MKIKNRILVISVILGLCLCIFANSSFAVTGTVTGEHVRIRKSASSSSIEVSLATKGEKVDVIGEEGNWYKVTFEGVTGYISKDYVDTTYTSSPSTTSTETPTSDESTSNGPTQSEETTETTEEPAEELDTSTQEPEQTETSVENDTQIVDNNEQKTGIYVGATATVGSEIGLRYLPNYASRVGTTVPSGSSIVVKDELGNWVKISDENVTGWIAKSDVSGIFPEANGTLEDTTTGSETSSSDATSTDNQSTTDNASTEPVSTTPVKTGKVNTESVRIRKTPNGEIIDTVDKGTKVEILGEEDGWYEINVGEHKNCYIAKRLVTED